MIAQFLFSDDFKLKYTFTIILLDIYSLEKESLITDSYKSLQNQQPPPTLNQ